MTARRDERMLVPKAMYKVDVRVHANEGALKRAAARLNDIRGKSK